MHVSSLPLQRSQRTIIPLLSTSNELFYLYTPYLHIRDRPILPLLPICMLGIDLYYLYMVGGAEEEPA